MDPTVPYESISLLDLTVLVNDPSELATMLTRLIDEDAGGEVGVVMHMDVAAEQRSVGHDHTVPHAAIVPNVRRCQKQIPAADGSDPTAFDGAAVDGHVFAECIFVADEQLGSFATESPILWIAAD